MQIYSLFISGNCSTCFGCYLHPPDDGWRYHPKHLEQFSEINKLCEVASCWIYVQDIQGTVTLSLRAIPQADVQRSFQSLLDRATRCIDAEGMYFE